MNKITLLLTLLLFGAAATRSQTVVSILEARAQPVGSVVTIRGILLNDASKMGWTYYLQDETGGIAGYDKMFGTAGVKPGDILTVTGTLKNYNSLLEISPTTSVVIVSSNNPLPAPAVLSIPDVNNGTAGEDNESMLVTLKNVHFATADQGKVYSAGTSGFNYNIYDQAGNTMQVRILPLTDINGTLIPFGNVDITGCLGQYSPSNPATGYQLVPRELTDIKINSSILLTNPVSVEDITTTSVKLKWTTDNPGSTFVKYGHTTALELGTITGTGGVTEHSVTIPGNPAELFYAKAYSVSTTVNTDTAKSSIGAYITESNSSGNIKVYFNTPVDHSVSSGTNAIFLDQAVDDTLISYINRARYTIDVAIYSFDDADLSGIGSALNAAADRGVKVRFIYCGTTASAGVVNLGSGVKVLQAPGSKNPTYSTRDGIMHDKFMIIDANSANASEPLVWTGSANWTGDNMNTDANNVIIVQDQSLARTYQVEFEEMWGSNTQTPSAANAKYGKNKADNTPHMLKVGGKWFECYFSPSDNVNATIVNKVKTAESSIEAAIMLITRKEMAYAITDLAKTGIPARILVNSKEDCAPTSGTPPVADYSIVNAFSAAVGDNFNDYTGGGVMHNKYLIIDQSNVASDPLVWTGSHNWSASANNYNDENSIVIHDATIANLYYQNFNKIAKSSSVITKLNPMASAATETLSLFPNPATSAITLNFHTTKTASYTLRVLDLTGRVVMVKNALAIQGSNTEILDVSKLSKGIYTVQATGNFNSRAQKFIVK